MIDILLQNPLGQGLGIIAMLILFYGLTNKDDTKILKVLMVSIVFWIAHFYVMEMYAGVAGSVIGLIRTFLSLKYKYNKKIFSSIIVITLIAGYYTYTDYYSLLPIVASCISVYGYFFFDKVKLRLFMMVTSLFWLFHNLGNGLIGGIINEVVVQVILLVAMYKMIHEEGRNIYFIDSLISKFHKPEIDVGRYISIYDFINLKKRTFTEKIKNLFRKLKKD